MPQELGLVGNEYNVALVILSVGFLQHALSCAHRSTSFVPYVILEIPGNFFLKKFKPHVWRKLQAELVLLPLLTGSV